VLNFDSDCSRTGQDGGDNAELSKAGAKVDEHVIFREPALFDHCEYVSNRRGLIEDLLVPWADYFDWIRNLQDSGDKIIQMVVAQPGC
jgi:hypothetical protein